jgi:hypothetical protein
LALAEDLADESKYIISTRAATSRRRNKETPKRNRPPQLRQRNRIDSNSKPEDATAAALDSNADIVRAILQDYADETDPTRANNALSSMRLLIFAREKPVTYVHMLGYISVISEMVLFLTPAIAMGLQWVTALCNRSSFPVILDIFLAVGRCIGEYLAGGQCRLKGYDPLSEQCLVQESPL